MLRKDASADYLRSIYASLRHIVNLTLALNLPTHFAPIILTDHLLERMRSGDGLVIWLTSSEQKCDAHEGRNTTPSKTFLKGVCDIRSSPVLRAPDRPVCGTRACRLARRLPCPL